jgi:hypothetical protein
MNSGFLNDGTNAPPRLEVWLNLVNLEDLRPDTCWPGYQGLQRDERLAADGFKGIQLTDSLPPVSGSTLPFCGLNRINLPEEAEAVAAAHAARGDRCLTVHAGWGIEDDAEVFRLVEAILSASAKHRLPIFIETHRATITQDMWRTVQIIKRFPEVRFNGDFSHFYAGQEMVYGGLEMKLEFMRPIFERVAFMHARIASPGSIQATIGDGRQRPPVECGLGDYLADFKKIWTHAFQGFLKTAQPGDYLIFCPELLSSTFFYARKYPDGKGGWWEESDRYQQALLYQQIAKECFSLAQG